MPYLQLVKLAHALYNPALELRDAFPREKRQRIANILSFLLALFFVLALILFGFSNATVTTLIPGLGFLGALAPHIYGALLVVFALRFCFSALEAFHRSFYYRGLDSVLHEGEVHNTTAVSFEVAVIVHATSLDDITLGFLNSPYGLECMDRLGLSGEELSRFENERKGMLKGTSLMMEHSNTVTLVSYARMIVTKDAEFESFLFSLGIDKELFLGAVDWVENIHTTRRKRERWWSKDMLGRIPSIGKAWGYGITPELDKVGHDITSDPVFAGTFGNVREEDDEIDAMEAVLARGRQSNVLLIGKAGGGLLESVAMLARIIYEGFALPPLEGKRIVKLDIELVVAQEKTKGAIETRLIRVMQEAMHAGNVIIFIDQVPNVIESAASVGVNIVSVLEPYLASTEVHFIFSSDPMAHQRVLFQNKQFMQYVEVVQMHSVDKGALIRIVEQRALALEAQAPMLITYQAIHEIIESAERYFPDGVMPDKAFDLLSELVATVPHDQLTIILAEDVKRLVSGKTGIPTGELAEGESEVLLNLENAINERVIGQHQAVQAIAGAMRRSRAGVTNPDRPIGSFLFLGPTGVGKTETAKALSALYFKKEDAMHRLDMSEFRGPQALDRLIGSSQTQSPGRLSSMLREHPYALLLLDEFEKTEPEVHDLFLQILDEGEFTDAFGEGVNAHNVIIIATSNAGADKIWQLFQQQQNPSEHADELIDLIVSRGEYRPELINRFDGVIVFNPINPDMAKEIARLRLNQVVQRMHDRGIAFVITDELVDYVAREGYDPQFGARPMNRLIQDRIEQIVADKIIKGEIQRGQEVKLSEADLT